MLNSIVDFLDEETEYVRDFIDRVSREILPSVVTAISSPFTSSLRYDLLECFDKYIIEMELPGVSGENLSIVLEDRNEDLVYLVIECEKHRTFEMPGYIRRERKVGKMVRNILLPVDCNLDSLSGKLKRGVLTITISKLNVDQELQPIHPNLVETDVDANANTNTDTTINTTTQQPEQLMQHNHNHNHNHNHDTVSQTTDEPPRDTTKTIQITE